MATTAESDGDPDRPRTSPNMAITRKPVGAQKTQSKFSSSRPTSSVSERSPVSSVNRRFSRQDTGYRKPSAPGLQHSGSIHSMQHPPLPEIQACSHCGAQKPEGMSWEAMQRRIAELETEVKILTEKASSAADKLADCEDELQKLKSAGDAASGGDNSPNQPYLFPPRSPGHAMSASSDNKHPAEAAGPTSSQPEPSSQQQHNGEPARSASPQPAAAPNPAVTSLQPEKPALGRSLTKTRITNFLSARRASPANNNTESQQASSSSSNNPRNSQDLNAQLAHEQSLRRAAESKLNQTNQELEDLSVSLFQQANEMVAAERKARVEGEERAKQREKEGKRRARGQEEKVRRLEGRVKVLEERETERGKRLDRLELAMKRVSRVKEVLNEGVVVATATTTNGQLKPYSYGSV
ncbi:MAG: hypothetical protein M1831_004757 [Alyxoria varia]|nr:MAG: hypothetical protein M1831_004757 [Alyxoria varia]